MDKLMGPVDGAYWNLRSHHVAKAAVLRPETAEANLDGVGVSHLRGHALRYLMVNLENNILIPISICIKL